MLFLLRRQEKQPWNTRIYQNKIIEIIEKTILQDIVKQCAL